MDLRHLVIIVVQWQPAPLPLQALNGLHQSQWLMAKQQTSHPSPSASGCSQPAARSQLAGRAPQTGVHAQRTM